jgi:hypothetical protein
VPYDSEAPGDDPPATPDNSVEKPAVRTTTSGHPALQGLPPIPPPKSKEAKPAKPAPRPEPTRI